MNLPPPGPDLRPSRAHRARPVSAQKNDWRGHEELDSVGRDGCRGGIRGVCGRGRGARPRQGPAATHVSRKDGQLERGAVGIEPRERAVLRRREQGRHGLHVLVVVLRDERKRLPVAHPLRSASHQRRHQRLVVPGHGGRAGQRRRADARRARCARRRRRSRRRSMPADVVGPAGQGISRCEFAELLAAIRAGAAYANVHSGAAAGPPVVGFPGGEIRGQIN